MFNIILPMTGFEPRAADIGSNRSTNEPQPLPQNLFFTFTKYFASINRSIDRLVIDFGSEDRNESKPFFNGFAPQSLPVQK